MSFQARERASVLVTWALILVPLLLSGLFLAGRYHNARQTLDRVEPRYARLLGLEAAQAQLTTAIMDARAVAGQFAYPASQDAGQAGNDAQQRIRSAFTAARMDIVSSQVLGAKVDKNVDRVPLSVRVEGDLASLQNALASMASQSPTILIDTVSIQGNQFARADNGRLVVQISFFVLRART